VPERPLAIDLQCLATVTGAFHGIEDLHCNWPPSGSGAPLLAITGALSDIRRPETATIRVETPGLPAATLLEWLHVASSRIPADVSVAGVVSGNLAWSSGSSLSGWSGEMLMKDAALISPHAGTASLVSGDIAVQSVTTEPAAMRRGRRKAAPAVVSSEGFSLAPVSLELGGKDPATLEGHFNTRGYTFHLTGMASTARMLALGTALPQLGDGLAQTLPTNRASGPYRVDLTASRQWGGAQVWTDGTAHAVTTTTHVRGR
jgi:hypothetical protein